ncbi:protein kinase domain-containing protein [Alkalibacillus almallahensis]|uniref:protein kinase domain-containing protein n=1 Tax=Alkalibacillus almallahensis TaxID=1379154 RepID=UPI001422ECE2|nr:phosphotransferase [Alkalibacillus almallahensis]
MMSSIHPTVRLANGTKINGLWHKRQYQIKQLLGEGARGSTYLVEASGKKVALKISRDPSVVTAEANILKKLQRAQSISLGPSLIDVDDGYLPNRMKQSFYVMEYVQGKPMTTLVGKLSLVDLGRLMSRLLSELHQLHSMSYIFGDLKLDNMIFDDSLKRIRLVDVGGVTQVGRGIREYTSIYDRGFWRLGGRKAEPTYDLFALAICLMHAERPLKFDSNGQQQILWRFLSSSKRITPFQQVIKQALLGKYRDALHMKRDVDQVVQHLIRSRPVQQRTTKVNNRRISERDLITLSGMVAFNGFMIYILL